MENKTDIIIGIHSIREALLNLKRSPIRLVGTKKSIQELKSGHPDLLGRLSSTQIEYLELQQWHEIFSKILRDRKQEVLKHGQPLFLESQSYGTVEWVDFCRSLDRNNHSKTSMVALDQVTDVHNAAAIMRTSAFYGVDYLSIETKYDHPLSPSFFKIASGATEHVKLLKISHLSRVVQKCRDKHFLCVGFSEDGIEEQLFFQQVSEASEKKKYDGLLFVLGAEDQGISPAVKRVLPYNIKLQATKDFCTLNVSSALAIILERYKNILKKHLA
jgi:23S rRNA (guanosine2251-2'-O)-methyltransferase